MTKLTNRAALAALLMLAFAVPAAGQKKDRDRDRDRDRDCEWDECETARGSRQRIDTTFAFDRRGTLDLSATSGDIQVTGWTRADIRIQATTEYGSLDLDPGATRVTLKARATRGRLGETKFIVSVPTGTRVIANTMSGDITLAGTRGEVEASTMQGAIDVTEASDRVELGNASGDITVKQVSGTVRLRALSGEIDVRQATGDVEVETVSGDIVMMGVTSRFLRAESTSGDVEFDGSVDPAGRYEFRSHSGDVRIDMAGTVSAAVDVETYSGTIESDFPITLQPGERSTRSQPQRYDFTIGDGRARMSIESFSGDIRIVKRTAP